MIDLYIAGVQPLGHMESVDPFPALLATRWKVRWLVWRNRMIANPGFQRRAAANPLLRPLARRRAARLFDLVAGFSYSQVLLASVESGLLDLLESGPIGIDAIAGRTGLKPEAARRLVRAAAALDLAESVGEENWMLGQQGAALSGNPGALAMIRHHRLLYADLADPVALLRDDRTSPTALSEFWRYGGDGETAKAYSELMALSQAMVAEQFLAAYSLARHRALLDVGGGHATFLGHVAQAAPHLRLGLFDLPAVVQGAGGLPGASRHEGDFFHDPIPIGYDCVTLVRVLHDHDDAPCLTLLRAIRAALPAGGRLVIAEPMAGTPAAPAMGDAYFGMYLWAMRSGRPRTAAEIGALLERAGFRQWRERTTPQPLVASMIVAQT